MPKVTPAAKSGSVRDAWEYHGSAVNLLALLPTLPVDPACLSPLHIDSDPEDNISTDNPGDDLGNSSLNTAPGVRSSESLLVPSSSSLSTADEARSLIYSHLALSQKTMKHLRSSARLHRRATDPCFTTLPNLLPEVWDATETCFQRQVETFKRHSALKRLYGPRAPRDSLGSLILGGSSRVQKRSRVKRGSSEGSTAQRARLERQKERRQKVERQEVWDELRVSMMLLQELSGEWARQGSDTASIAGSDRGDHLSVESASDGGSDVDMEAPLTVEERIDAEEAEIVRLALLAQELGIWLEFQKGDHGSEVGLSCMWRGDDYEVDRLLACERPPMTEQEYRATVQKHDTPARSDTLSSSDRASDTSLDDDAKADGSDGSASMSDSASSPTVASTFPLR